MDLRVMKACDLDGAVRVWQAANIARGKHPSPERVVRVVKKLREPTAAPYVAADDGAGAVVPDALFIEPASQRQGVGSRLMRYVLDNARTSGVSSVSLWTDCENTGAHKLYEVLGMKPTRTRRVSETVEWVRYELDL